MKAIVGKWGRSIAVRLPRDVQDRLRLKAGDEVEIDVEGETASIRRSAPRRFSAQALFEQMEDCERPDEADWGPPRGREVW